MGIRRLTVWTLSLTAFLACSPQGALVSSDTPSPSAAPTPTASAAQPPPCSRVELAGAPAANVEAGTLMTFTAMAYGCNPVDYRFIWLQVGTGDWMVARDWGPSPLWTWDTRPFSPAQYSIVADARARYELGNSPDVSTSMGVAVLTPAALPGVASTAREGSCTAVTVTATPASTVTAGTILFVKMAASGCTQPEFRLSVVELYAGGTTLRRDWGPSPDWSWETTRVNPGRYSIQVDVRQQRPGRAGYELDSSSQITVVIQSA